LADECPEVADEANPGKEASPTGRAEVGRRCVGAGGSSLACCRARFYSA